MWPGLGGASLASSAPGAGKVFGVLGRTLRALGLRVFWSLGLRGPTRQFDLFGFQVKCCGELIPHTNSQSRSLLSQHAPGTQFFM